jgi:hypothetical protein
VDLQTGRCCRCPDQIHHKPRVVVFHDWALVSTDGQLCPSVALWYTRTGEHADGLEGGKVGRSGLTR